MRCHPKLRDLLSALAMNPRFETLIVLVHPASTPPIPENDTATAISWEQKNLLVHWKSKGFLIVHQTVLLRPLGSGTYLQVVQVPG